MITIVDNLYTLGGPCWRCAERPSRYWVCAQDERGPVLACEDCWRETDLYVVRDGPECKIRLMARALGFV